jgi:phosphorylcholine metabolism protein LicD
MNIWYVITFGTLLGATRHRNLIPWDDDIDIFVKHSDLPKIKLAMKEMENLGFTVDNTWKLIQIYDNKNKSHKTQKLCVDLFIISEQYDDPEKIMRCYNYVDECRYNPKNDKWWWKGYSFPKKWILERKKYEFSGLSLWGPTYSWQFLRHMYGDNFLSICQTPKYDHKTLTYVTPKSKYCPNTYPNPQF